MLSHPPAADEFNGSLGVLLGLHGNSASASRYCEFNPADEVRQLVKSVNNTSDHVDPDVLFF